MQHGHGHKRGDVEPDGHVHVPFAPLEDRAEQVDGEKDPMRISHFISTIPIRDSQSFRKYVTDNTPGLDKGVEITLPSEKKIQTFFNLDTEFFRPFYGL